MTVSTPRGHREDKGNGQVECRTRAHPLFGPYARAQNLPVLEQHTERGTGPVLSGPLWPPTVAFPAQPPAFLLPRKMIKLKKTGNQS